MLLKKYKKGGGGAGGVSINSISNILIAHICVIPIITGKYYMLQTFMLLNRKQF